MKAYIYEFINDEMGAYTLEVAIVTAAIIALALAFRKQLGEMWRAISGKNEEYINKIKDS